MKENLEKTMESLLLFLFLEFVLIPILAFVGILFGFIFIFNLIRMILNLVVSIFRKESDVTKF